MENRLGTADYRCELCGERILDTAPHYCLIKDLRQGKSEEELRSREPEDIVINQDLAEKHKKQIAEILGKPLLQCGMNKCIGNDCTFNDYDETNCPAISIFIDLGDLLRCVWAINDDVKIKYFIREGFGLFVIQDKEKMIGIAHLAYDYFRFELENVTSKQTALTAALICVLDRIG